MSADRRVGRVLSLRSLLLYSTWDDTPAACELPAPATDFGWCGEAGEAQGILQGSFDENFSATSWESYATS